jgi:hypothetical protein
MSISLRRQDRPPKPGPEMRIRRLKASQKIVATVLNDLWGCWTHWAGNRSEPCLGDKKTCPGHKRGLPARWKGYLHILDHNNREESFLELTPTAATQLFDQLGTESPLRGNRIQVERMAGDKARMRITVLTAHLSDVQLPPAKDPYKTLCSLWGVSDVSLEKPGQPTLPLNDAI